MSGTVPLKYESDLKSSDYDKRTLKFAITRGGEKLELTFPIYDNQEDYEILLKLLRDFNKAIDRYSLWVCVGEARVYDYFQRCLSGAALDAWTGVVDDEKQEVWEDNIADLIERILGEDAHENMVDYLKDTKKPNNMSIKGWLMRMQAINTYLPFLESGGDGDQLTERELVKYISKNIPRSWKKDYKIARGHREQTVLGAQRILLILEENEEKKKAKPATRGARPKDPTRKGRGGNGNRNGNGNGNGNGGGNRIKNPCKLPGHSGHEYKDCFFNPKSKNFKGVVRLLKDYDKDGKLKQSTNKREEEANVCLRCPKKNKSTSKAESDDSSVSSDESDDSSYEDFGSTEEMMTTVDDDKESQALSADMMISIPTGIGSKTYKSYRMLIDNGASDDLANENIISSRSGVEEECNSTWKTKVGTFTTTKKVRVKNIKLPQFTASRSFDTSFHLFKPSPGDKYDFVMGRKTQQRLGLDIINSSKSFSWGGIQVSMVPKNHFTKSAIGKLSKKFNGEIQEQAEVLRWAEREEECYAIRKILESKYEKMDTTEVVGNQTHLTDVERQVSKEILDQRVSLFQGERGKWKGVPVDIKLRTGATPYSARPYPIPKAHRKLVKEEVQRLVSIGLLTQVEASEWAAPSFAIPKKDQRIRFVTDFRKLNECLVREPYPLPVIQDVLHTLGAFRYATCIDLSMGYYSMSLNEAAKKLCVTCLPWGLYQYNMLPMGIKVASDVFQSAMGRLFLDMEEVLIYIDDILILGTGSFGEHMKTVDEVLQRLEKYGLQVNPLKSFWAQDQVEYLGFLITRDGIRPQVKKVQGILDMGRPTNTKQLRGFVGMINYYKSLWPRRSHLLAPLTAMTSKNIKFKWEQVHENAFQLIKKMVAQDTMLIHPDFSKTFILHTDASDLQIGGVISQDGKPIAYFSKKLNAAQMKYTTIDKELLAIVETLRHFRTILLGHEIVIFTDHKNLTYPNSDHGSQRVLRQRLIIEEYGAELRYVKGESNVVADTLSRIPINTITQNSVAAEEEVYLNRRVFEDSITFPLDLDTIREGQKDDAHLERLLKDVRTKNKFRKEKVQDTRLWTMLDKTSNEPKIFVPKKARKDIIDWFHTNLHHIGDERTQQTIKQHFAWPGLGEEVSRYIRKCPICQKKKKTGVKNYGKVPMSLDTSTAPFDVVHLDMIGPWSIKCKIADKRVSVAIQALTMVDKATNWPEIIQANEKNAELIARLFDRQWLCRYPRPKKVIHDNGGEFTGFEFQEMMSSYGIKAVPTTVKNPRSNSIAERMHLTMGDMLRTMEFEGPDWKEEIDTALQSVAWAIRSTVSMTTGHTPGQLLFSRDMIMQVRVVADWERIKAARMKAAATANQQENKTRLDYQYQIGDKILVKKLIQGEVAPKMADPYEGPYEILKVYKNGTLKIKRGSYEETIHIRRVKPFRE